MRLHRFEHLQVILGIWNYAHSRCKDDKIQALGDDRIAESALEEIAREAQEPKPQSDIWDASIRAEGHILIFTYKFKTPIVDMADFYRWVAQRQQSSLKDHCSEAKYSPKVK